MSDDSHTWQCPDCPKKNPLSVWKCICGYEQPKFKRQASDGTRDHRLCHYVSAAGRQCPLPGDISTDGGREPKKWCSGHREHSMGRLAEQIYEDNVRNYPEIMARIKASNDLLGWYEKEGRARDERLKAESLAKKTEQNDRMSKNETHISEEAAERAAIQDEGFSDERF